MAMRASAEWKPCALAGTRCISEQPYTRDDEGARLIDSAPPGSGQSIGDISLSGNALTLSCTTAPNDGSTCAEAARRHAAADQLCLCVARRA